RRDRRKGKPLCHSRHGRGSCRGKQLRLECTRRARVKKLLQLWLFQKLTHITRRSRIRPSRSLFGVDGQQIASASHCHVKQTSFLLVVAYFASILTSGLSGAQFTRKFHQRLNVGSRK